MQVGTPLCIPSRDGIDIGKIASMEINHKVVDTAKKGQQVAMKVSSTNRDCLRTGTAVDRNFRAREQSHGPLHDLKYSVCGVTLQIVGTNAEENARMFGRHFDMEDEFVSRISRRSIDLLKENYRVSFNSCVQTIMYVKAISNQIVIARIINVILQRKHAGVY